LSFFNCFAYPINSASEIFLRRRISIFASIILIGRLVKKQAAVAVCSYYSGAEEAVV